MTLRAWFDRQLGPRSADRTGLSALNICIILLIGLSAVLFALETETSLPDDVQQSLSAINLVILFLFAAEFLVRIWASGAEHGITGFAARLRHAEPVWLTIDFLAFAPELVMLAFIFVTGHESHAELEILRLMRILRVGKLVRYVPGVRILMETIASVKAELIASASLAIALIFLSAVLIYFAEGATDPVHFGSVPRALWWSVITLTTVGYGDVLPHTLLGRIAAGLVSLVGVGIVALPSGIIAGAFIERLQARRVRKHKADDDPTE